MTTNLERVAFTVAGVLCALWLSVQIDGVRRANAPATDWLEVDSVTVHDAVEGQAPTMAVQRTIRQPFFAEWTVTVRNISDGSISFACIAEGRADYAVDAKLPSPFTADWWTFPTKCRPPPGRYRLDTHWRIHPDRYPEKQIRVQSNEFHISPKSGA
jgi:hypothetical protein